jgi:phage FluMu gp28-like protein
VAPVYPQAKIAFRRLKRALPREIYTANESDLFIRLVNHATIWFKTGENPDNLYGEDVYAAVIDEASRVKAEAWHAVRSTLTATNGPVRMIGNVKGRQNWFYQLARKAESGEQGMSYHKLLAYDAVQAGVLSAEEVEDARRTLPEQVFRELYLAEPTDDGGNPFGLAAIRQCVGPLSAATPAAWGWDLAKSVDWTVGVALDAAGNACRFERFQKPWQDTIHHIRQATDGVQALVDSTGVGDPVLEALQHGKSNFEGFKFSQTSKQQLMEGLAVAIQRKEISFPEGPIAMELEQFEFEYTRTGVRYSAPEGLHDDCVCALALAVRRRSEPTASPRIRGL